MPRYSNKSASPEIRFEDLDWAKMTYFLNLGKDTSPIGKVEYEYNGEDYETPEEYQSRINAINNALVNERLKEDKANAERRKEYLLAFKRSGVMPQLLATVGVLPLVMESGKVRIKDTILNWIELTKVNKIIHKTGKPISAVELKGMISFLTFRVRGSIINGTQTKDIAYNASVPLVLRAFKEYQNINYSQYDYNNSELSLFVDEHSLEFMKLDATLFDIESLKEIHNKYSSLEYKVMAANITNEPIFEEYGLSIFMCAALAQVWIYMPHLWHTYAMHNFADFDKSPVPLVEEELFAVKPKSLMPTKLSQKAKYNTEEDKCPW